MEPRFSTSDNLEPDRCIVFDVNPTSNGSLMRGEIDVDTGLINGTPMDVYKEKKQDGLHLSCVSGNINNYIENDDAVEQDFQQTAKNTSFYFQLIFDIRCGSTKVLLYKMNTANLDKYIKDFCYIHGNDCHLFTKYLMCALYLYIDLNNTQYRVDHIDHIIANKVSNLLSSILIPQTFLPIFKEISRPMLGKQILYLPYLDIGAGLDDIQKLVGENLTTFDNITDEPVKLNVENLNVAPFSIWYNDGLYSLEKLSCKREKLLALLTPLVFEKLDSGRTKQKLTQDFIPIDDVEKYDFEIGDLAYISQPSSNFKTDFKERKIGPYKVIKKLPNFKFRLDIPVSKLNKEYHASYLRIPNYDFFFNPKILQNRKLKFSNKNVLKPSTIHPQNHIAKVSKLGALKSSNISQILNNKVSDKYPVSKHFCNQKNPKTGKSCNKEFSRSYDLIRHQNTIHATIRHFYRCVMCEDDFRRALNLPSMDSVITSIAYRNSRFSKENSENYYLKHCPENSENDIPVDENSGYLSNKKFSRYDALSRHLTLRHGLESSNLTTLLNAAKNNVEYTNNSS